MELLNHEQLQDATGYKCAADIAVCLRNQGIKFVIGKRGRIWTTKEAVNAAMGIGFDSFNKKRDHGEGLENLRPEDIEA